MPAEGRVQDEGGAVRGWSLKEWGEGEAGLGRRGIRGIQELGEVERSRASRCSVEGRSQVTGGTILLLDRRSVLEAFHT